MDMATAPGVIKPALITYVTANDVQILLGCAQSKAYLTIREVNKSAKEKGNFGYGAGKANKYLFAEKYNIPMEVVNEVISSNSRR